MPFQFNQFEACPACSLGYCIEDRRQNPVRGRSTKFRFRQDTALDCTFDSFVPGTDSDPEPGRGFDTYLSQFRGNVMAAGKILFGETFALETPALAKVEGDAFELLEAASLWNAAAAWNTWMDTGTWPSHVFTQPNGVPTPQGKIAILKLPRGYDTTQLFRSDVRARILAHENALQLRGMELGLSSPDIVGVRIPDPIPPGFAPALTPLTSMAGAERDRLLYLHQDVEGTLLGQNFLFAIAVKRTTRSDRLYQPLFEANVLKYLIQEVLRVASFRFHVHLGSLAGADVIGHYKAASLVSLLRGGDPALAVDRVWESVAPAQTAQMVLDELPLFPY